MTPPSWTIPKCSHASVLISNQVKSSQVANPRNAFCIEQRTAAKSKEAQVRVFGLFAAPPACAGWADCTLTCLRLSWGSR